MVSLRLCSDFVLVVSFLQTLDFLEQDALGTRNLVLLASNPGGSHSDSSSDGLEGTLGLVVVVLSSQHIDMHGNTGTLGETLQDVRYHFGRQITQLLPFEDGWLTGNCRIRSCQIGDKVRTI